MVWAREGAEMGRDGKAEGGRFELKSGADVFFVFQIGLRVAAFGVGTVLAHGAILRVFEEVGYGD